MSLKDAVIGTLWGDRFYQLAMRPFDRYLVAPLTSGAPAEGDPPLNKVCRTTDAGHPLWRRGYDDLGFPDSPSVFHRKIWEFNQALYGLRRLNRLAPDATALGIGCGHEELMYFLANRIRRVIATDLYEGSWIGGESDADVLAHPAKYAPFKYREDHLEVRRMDALALEAEAASVDFVFCLSSIEHFGRLRDKLTSLREMHRVLKPGGVAVLTTEVVLNRLGRGRQYFRIETLRALIAEAGFSLDHQPDLRVEQEFAARPLALPMDTFVSPHVVLRNFNTIYTSVALFLMKPAAPDPAANAIAGAEVAAPMQRYRYAAEIAADQPAPVAPGGPLTVRLSIVNRGDATWFAGGDKSHNIRIGAAFVAADGTNLTGEPQRFALPDHVRPQQRVTVQLDLVAPAAAPAGRLHLRVGLVKEHYFWFRDAGSPDADIPIDLTA
ncbi:MAG: class I SAM-dependent methyltransferase [Vicinamibacterales bacterium]